MKLKGFRLLVECGGSKELIYIRERIHKEDYRENNSAV